MLVIIIKGDYSLHVSLGKARMALFPCSARSINGDITSVSDGACDFLAMRVMNEAYS